MVDRETTVTPRASLPWTDRPPCDDCELRTKNAKICNKCGRLAQCSVRMEDVLRNPGNLDTKNSIREVKRARSDNEVTRSDPQTSKKSKREIDLTPHRATRASSIMSNVSTTSNASKQPQKRRYSDNFGVPDAPPKRPRGRPSKNVNKSQADKPEDTKKVAGKSPAPVPAKKASKKSTINAPSSSRRSSVSSILSVTDGATRRSQRVRKPTKPWSETSDNLDSSDDDDQEIVVVAKKTAEKTLKTSARKPRGRPPGSIKNKEAPKGEQAAAGSDGESRPYMCTVCDTEFASKLVGMTHELTHSKKLGVVLEKVSVKDVTKEKDITAKAAVAESVEDSADVDDASNVTKDADLPEKDEHAEEEGEQVQKAKDQEPEIAASENMENSEQPLEIAKQPEEETPVESQEAEEIDNSASEKLRETETSKENDGSLIAEEKETEEPSKNVEESVEDADAVEETEQTKEVEKEKRESALIEENDKEHSEEIVDDIDSQGIENDNVEKDSGCKSPMMAELPEKEDVPALTNGEDVQAPVPQAQDMNNDKEEEATHNDEEKEKKLGEEENKEEIDENKKDSSEQVVNDPEEKKSEEPEDVEDTEVPKDVVYTEVELLNQSGETEDWESDEEMSPEAEPLSPPRRAESINGDTSIIPELEKNHESEKTLVIETNWEDMGIAKELEVNSNGEESQEVEITKGDVIEEKEEDLCKSAAKAPEDVFNIDEASMDAIERQMETIVGGEDKTAENHALRRNASISLVNSTVVAGEKQAS